MITHGSLRKETNCHGHHRRRRCMPTCPYHVSLPLSHGRRCNTAPAATAATTALAAPTFSCRRRSRPSMPTPLPRHPPSIAPPTPAWLRHVPAPSRYLLRPFHSPPPLGLPRAPTTFDPACSQLTTRAAYEWPSLITTNRAHAPQVRHTSPSFYFEVILLPSVLHRHQDLD